MSTLLQINASIHASQGQSSLLANRLVAGWKAKNPGGNVAVRDLAADPVPHLDAARFGAFLAKPEERSAKQQAVVAFSDALIDEIKSASVVVLGLPMYNFGIPSTLKAWIDHIARAGTTFRYTETGPVGLLTGKKVYVLAARGGKYAGTPLDSQTDYIRAFFGFLGMTDIEFIYAEGLSMGEEPKQAALAQAHQQMEQLAA